MATPPAPSYLFSAHNKSQVTTRKISDKTTAKTPYQSILQRTFKTEAQPNRIGMRFANTENNNRFGGPRLGGCPLTTQRSQPSFRTNTFTERKISRPHTNVLSRLQTNFLSAIQPRIQPPTQQRQEPIASAEPKPNASTIAPDARTLGTEHQMPARSQSEPNIKYLVTINDKTYKILRKIGFGGSAKVYEGLESKTLKIVAIKIINLAQADLKAQESYFNERKILMKLSNSRHVVRMYDSEHKQNLKELLIVMEKGDVDLSQVIEDQFKNRGKSLDGIFIKFYWQGIVQAVREIHRHGIVHADLKPVNFILVKNQVKLIDFGIANAIEPDCTSIIRDYQIGTINYMAPEALRNRALDASFQIPQNGVAGNEQHKTVIKYNSKADIWSLGCILYNLVYSRPPFDRYKELVSKIHAITNPNHEIHFPRINNTRLLDSMRSCLNYNPNDRPTAQELLDHPYLKEDTLWVEQAEIG